jgi:ssDNA-binding Zn-finger/Zn-ribbon topoisomerase 1
MAVKVRCPGCQKVLSAPDEARGKAIKCPSCQTRVPIPKGDGAAAAKPAAKPAKKPAAQADGESALASLDLRNAEDVDARICPKCGHDMTYQDEEESECPKCGYDAAAGGLGEKARKRQLKGPDPDKFYASLWKGNWKFVFKNQGIAWRTVLYVLIASMLTFLCAFLYLYIPMWPPRVFFALCTVVSAMMIPGWLWFMDEQIIVATLTKKDKLKRVNFDFFLCSALGIKWVAWHLVFASLVLLIPFLIGYAMTKFGGMPDFVMGICLGIGYLPVLAMLPIVMGHMVMPIQSPGWMVWKVFPAWLRTLKPTLLWMTLTLFLHLPVLGLLGAIAAISGPQINLIAVQMEENAATYRAKVAADNAPKAKQGAAVDPDPLAAREMHKVNYMPLILPFGLWVGACLFLGFPAVYSCRLNGQFVYYFREQLDLQALAKEYKYVARARPDEDEDKPPKTIQEVLIESAIVTAVCVVLGVVGGAIIGSLSQGGSLVSGMLIGLFYGPLLAVGIGHLMIMGEAFKENVGWGIACWFFGAPADAIFVATHWEEGRGGCLTQVFGALFFTMSIVLLIAGVLTFGALGLPGMGGGGGNFPEQFDAAPMEGEADPAADPGAAGAEPAGDAGAQPPAAALRAAPVPRVAQQGFGRTLAV